ncbi:hypothetical protein SGUI_0316 [Serinicoccus hydrothermalis]|uniref:Uncharacterized protein n=1 Tax=Serinicoccus hydrothermalis TaxID=1758689 RepID=A0A1B1N8F2_9MICO|nr:hypothetical protein SGUI_0316 [Serinicoccus hydrothermalis]
MRLDRSSPAYLPTPVRTGAVAPILPGIPLHPGEVGCGCTDPPRVCLAVAG